MTRFGMPLVIIFDNASYFSSTHLSKFSLEKGIIFGFSINYYAQEMERICQPIEI